MDQLFDPYYNWLGIPPAEQPPSHYRILGLAPLESNPTAIEHAADRLMIHLRTFATGPHGKESQQLLNEVATARVVLLDAMRKAEYDARLRERLGGLSAHSTPVPIHWSGLGTHTAQPSAFPPIPVSLAPPIPWSVAGESSPQPGFLPTPTVPLTSPWSIAGSLPLQSGDLPPLPVLPPRPIPRSLAGASVPLPAALPPLPVPITPPISYDNPVIAVVRGTVTASRRDPSRPNLNETEQQAATIINVVKIVMGGLGGLSMAILLVWIVFGVDALGLFSGGEAVQNLRRQATPGPQSNNISQSLPIKRPVVKVDPRPSARRAQPNTAASRPAVPMDRDPRPVMDPELPEVNAPDFSTIRDPTPKPLIENPGTPAAFDSATRQPEPTIAERRASLADLKTKYRREYNTANQSTGREKFPDFLLATADNPASSAVDRFVLLQDAFDRLIAARDFSRAVDVVDRLEQDFEVDSFSRRIITLTEASQGAGVDTRRTIVTCSLHLCELAASQQRKDDALKLVRIAENNAGILGDQELRAQALKLKLELEKTSKPPASDPVGNESLPPFASMFSPQG